MNTISPAQHVGVDVGKGQLDFFCHQSDERFAVPNTAPGIRQTLRRLSLSEIACLVVEATGRHEQALVQAAQDKGVPVVIAQPIAIRRFAGALGILAKTDQIDSRVIAQYAPSIQPTVRDLPDANTRRQKGVRALFVGKGL